jgi:hypothetical protein
MKHGANMDHDKGLAWLGYLFLAGAMIAVGKALASAEAIPFRVLIGRTLVGGTASMMAAALLALLPDLPFIALVGIACFIGQAGNELVMKLIGDWLAGKAKASSKE